MSPAFNWQMPVDLRFGAGCAEAALAELGVRPVVVLACAPARALGWWQRWSALLGERLAGWVEVPEGLASLAQARALAVQVWPLLRERPDAVLLAVGGGSTLDLAKLLRCLPEAGGFEALAGALRGGPWPALRRVPLWLLPTTAGTGSEVTRWATLWDTDSAPAQKRSFDEPWGFADRAFVDPVLTLSCPAAVTRDTALDALAHALEAIWNRHANPVSDALAVQAAQRVLDALPRVLQQPAALRTRSELALAALEAGMAFAQTRTALAHALSYTLTLEQGLPHGLACALWLPSAWRLAMGRDARVDRRLQQVFGAPPAEGLERLRRWLQAMGVEPDPQAHGIADADQRIAAALASPRGRNFIAAP